MLSFRHRSRPNEAVTQAIAGSEFARQSPAIVEAINQIERCGSPDLTDVPAEIAQALTSLTQSFIRRNQCDLRRAVAYSAGASEAVTNVARVVGDVNSIDQMAQAMSAAISELDTSMHNIASLGSTSAESMATANSIMAEGAQAVAGAGNAIDEIASVTAAMVTSVGALEDAANQIGDIVGAIESIASQTNLLALNATIEAARAGEAGKGFAVVAGEVKALSAQTSKATESIQQRISRLQSDVAELVKAMSAANKAVDTGRHVTMDAKDKISGLEHIFSENSMRMNEISSILGEQAEATRDLAKGVCKIADQVKSTRAHADSGIRSVASTDKFIGDQLTELEACRIPDYVLHRAKSDHIAWKKRLNEMMVGLNNLSPGELVDHHVCRLGKWYSDVRDEAIRKHPAFAKLERPHKAVHDHGKRAAELYAKGDRDGAYREVAEMEKSSDEVVHLLDALIAR